MAKYKTRAFNVGEITVTLSKEAKSPSAGDRLEAFLKLLSHLIVDPGFGQGGGSPPSVDNALPGTPGNRPDNSLPGAPPKPDQGLPPTGAPPKPDQGLPPTTGGAPPKPDQGLPGSQPGVDNDLPGFVHDNAKAIAKAILEHCMQCNTAQPK